MSETNETLAIRIEISLEEPDIQIGIENSVPDIEIEVAAGGEGKPPYEGEYTVVSDLHNQVIMHTRGTAMTDNVTVLPIPFYEASNPQGGITLTIGNQ